MIMYLLIKNPDYEAYATKDAFEERVKQLFGDKNTYMTLQTNVLTVKPEDNKILVTEDGPATVVMGDI